MCISNTWPSLFQEVCNGQTDLARVKRCHHTAPCICIHVTTNLCNQLSPAIMYSKVFVALNVITGTCNCMACYTQSPIDTLLLFYLVCTIMLLFILCLLSPWVPLSKFVLLLLMEPHRSGLLRWAVNICLHSVFSLEVQLPLDKITDERILTNSPYLWSLFHWSTDTVYLCLHYYRGSFSSCIHLQKR